MLVIRASGDAMAPVSDNSPCLPLHAPILTMFKRPVVIGGCLAFMFPLQAPMFF